ncbi:xanthine dehydrogenase family protein molybdopterin-binding subunit [Mesobacterium pallidum]|uniref:xanthine dehydrogenase family protein molybdopterin-binding subunit n=1 Tax=Mesobacterium pallidum TaxID=2872037 RepID=UPI001EE28C1D|nr:molybdopterin cofactor-binding domain-containing protein [Mesobacterium pallidum]
MASIGKIARRTFLFGTAAIAGGAAFGAWYVSRPAPMPLTSAPGRTALNPWIIIDETGVTVVAARAEMGQGVYSTLAAMAAEELDVAWDQVRVIHGPPAQAYFNGAMGGAAIPTPEYQQSAFQHRIGDWLEVIPKVFSMQITGGSTSTRDGFDKLRLAGATAREAMKEVAADRLGLRRSQLRTEGGQVIAPDGTTLAYAELAEAAAGVELGEVPLRPRSEWTLLGKTLPRLDMPAKCTGTATFGIDVRPEGLRFAALRRNPNLGAGMRGFDASAAKGMAGVEHVVELPDGVAVVATNTWLAQQAVNAIEVDWEPAPYPETTEAIFEAIEAAFDTDPNSTMRDDGDVTALPAGAQVIEASYRTPYLAHATMEPMNATVLFTGDALEIWAGNQGPVIARDRAAEAVGLDPEAVTFHTTLMGGGFGRRGEFDYVLQATHVAKAVPNVPIQLSWSREEDMSHDFYRPAALTRWRGAVADGGAVMLDGQIAGQSCSQQAITRWMGFAPGGPDKTHVEGASDQPYGVPAYRVRGHIADLAVPIGFWRSVGASGNAFGLECFMDEMAHAAGTDPIDFRLALMRGEHAPSAAVVEAVRDMSGWTGRTPDGVGRGMAFSMSFGTPVAEVIEVVQEDAGIRIARAWIAADVGVALDPGNLEAQLVGGMIYGLSAAVQGQITFAGGAVEQQQFYDYDGLRMHNTPAFEVQVLENLGHISGVGEPGTPPAAPALANALFDLTGRRARSLPLNTEFDLLV